MHPPLARLRDALPVGITTVWLRRILVANLVGQILIVVTGGIVRLTGSGLGCPTFPECVPGSYLPVVHQPQGIHKYIEFGNRMMTTVLSLLAVGALLAVLRYVRSGRGSRGLLVLSALPLVGVAVQALIGGVSVLTGLNPTVVAVHLLVSMGLIAVSAVLLLAALRDARARDGGAPGAGWAPSPAVTFLAVALGVVAAVVLTLGTLVTGSGPHSGDAADPNRFSFDIQVVARAHSASVWVFVLLLAALLVMFTRTGAPRAARRGAWALVGVTVLQGVIGYVQYALGVPAGLVALHMLGASLLVVATTATVYPVLVARAAPLREFGPLAGEDQPHEALPVQR